MTKYIKVVNGIEVPMSEDEIIQRKLEEIEWKSKKDERKLKVVLNKRKDEYGDIGEQLDMIFHSGIDAWKAHIQKVKDENPKPEVN